MVGGARCGGGRYEGCCALNKHQYFGEEFIEGSHQFPVVTILRGFSKLALGVDATDNVVQLRSGQDSWVGGEGGRGGRGRKN